jgi:hypothetical protein
MATDGWRYFGTFPDGAGLLLNGIDVWQSHWVDTGNRIAVEDPLYGQSYTFHVYEISVGDVRALFAAGEWSNCMWGFYVPSPP